MQHIAFVASNAPKAQMALTRMVELYGQYEANKADVIVVLGGDGFMLETLHQQFDQPVPVYGMNLGTVGFLLNNFKEEGLKERLAKAQRVHLHPLRMRAKLISGETLEASAINEVALMRQTGQAAKLKISVDGKVQMRELSCDGALVATPAGSTAYNAAAHGPIIPLGAGILALTPLNPFRPMRWRGALLPQNARITLTVLEPAKRPVSATADSAEVRDIASVEITQNQTLPLTLLFDTKHNLEKRILREQFRP